VQDWAEHQRQSDGRYLTGTVADAARGDADAVQRLRLRRQFTCSL
jgi:hypothetical protein